MIRQMTTNDLKQVVDIHQSSWSSKELSVKLGPEFLNLLYSQVIKSPVAFGYVYDVDGRIHGYAVGYHDCKAYNASLSKLRLMTILIKQILHSKITLNDIINLLSEDQKNRNLKYPLHQLGALALANQFKGTEAGKTAITGVMNAVLEELAKVHPGCFAVCDEENLPMRKYFLKLGFKEVDIIPLAGKNIVTYEITFAEQKQASKIANE